MKKLAILCTFMFSVIVITSSSLHAGPNFELEPDPDGGSYNPPYEDQTFSSGLSDNYMYGSFSRMMIYLDGSTDEIVAEEGSDIESITLPSDKPYNKEILTDVHQAEVEDYNATLIVADGVQAVIIYNDDAIYLETYEGIILVEVILQEDAISIELSFVANPYEDEGHDSSDGILLSGGATPSGGRTLADSGDVDYSGAAAITAAQVMGGGGFPLCFADHGSSFFMGPLC